MYQYDRIEADGAALRFEPLADRPRIARGFGSKSVARGHEAAPGRGGRIGAGRRLRSAIGFVLLCSGIWWLAPGLDPIPGASAAPLGKAEAREARAFAIAPLAYGADTGRRMAPTAAVEPLLDAPERATIQLVATIGQGDGFTRALERAGVTAADAEQAARSVAAIIPLDRIAAGTALAVTLGRRPAAAAERPLAALSFRARLDLALALTRAGGRLALSRTAIAVDSTPLRIRGAVGASLYRAARAAGAPAEAVEAYIRAIATQDGLSDLAPDDRFDIVLEHRRAATGESRTGRLLYAGLERGEGRSLELMPWASGGASQWFEASGVGKESGGLIAPVPGGISSGFGMRFHPILHYFRMHRGMDFHAAYGTPILAATDGKVIAAGWAGGYGNQVRLAHAGGLVTTYSHMSRIAAEPGAAVRQGQVIGYVGATGLATGPHLHYEIYKDGAAVDPAGVRFAVRARLAGPDLAAFRQRLKALLSLPTGGGKVAPRA